MAGLILGVDQVDVVRAAGGVVCRPGPADLLEVVVIHRPAYDDWTLPKGKLEPGETPEDAALREVTEETGLICELAEELGCSEYRDRRGRPKIVCFWRMHPLSGRFQPTPEVDEMRWLTIPEAVGLLTYERERELLRQLEGG